MDSFEKFVRDVLDGKLEPYLKSEPVPDNDQPLKVRNTVFVLDRFSDEWLMSYDRTCPI